MLYYLLVKKDGSTVLPAADAVYPQPAAQPPVPAAPSASHLATAPGPAPAAAAAAHTAPVPHPTPAVEAGTESGLVLDPASAAAAAPVSAASPAMAAAATAAADHLAEPTVPSLVTTTALSGASSLQPASPPPEHVPPCAATTAQLPQAAVPVPAPATAPPQDASLPDDQALLPPPHQALPPLEPAPPHLQQQPSQEVAGQQPSLGQSVPASAHDIGDQFLALLQDASSHLANTQQALSDKAAAPAASAGRQQGTDDEEDCTASWLHDHPAGNSPVHQPQLSQGHLTQAQLRPEQSAQPRHSESLPLPVLQPQAAPYIMNSHAPQAEAEEPMFSEAAPSTHLSPSGTPPAVHGSPANLSPGAAPTVGAAQTAGETASRQTGLKGVLSEACSNIIAQHQARRTPTHSRSAVWPPVQTASHQTALTSPDPASQTSRHLQVTGQPMGNPQLPPALASPNAALQLSGQLPQAEQQISSSYHQPACASLDVAVQTTEQQTNQQVTSAEHERQHVPTQSLQGIQLVPAAPPQQRQADGAQVQEQLAWYQYLNAQPEHEVEQVSRTAGVAFVLLAGHSQQRNANIRHGKRCAYAVL